MAALIRALVGFTRMSSTELFTYARAVVLGMTGNVAYPDPPIDIAIFAAAVTALNDALINAMDGSKSAMVARDAARETVVRYMRQLATYVEVKSDGDMATFISSGFRPKIKGASRPVSTDPFIRKIVRGPKSGILSVYIKASSVASSYFLRYSVLDGYATGPWTEGPVTKVKSAVVISGLSPTLCIPSPSPARRRHLQRLE
jgi:hypothetical protein